ncbi:MAG: DUF1491 family protein [Pseudomonadota bacterium]
MLEPRLATHVRVRALRQSVEAEGGFAMVLKKGDPVSGTLLVQQLKNGRNPALFEQMPGFDGPGEWLEIRQENPDNIQEYKDYLARRMDRDRDLWLVELDIADAERLVVLLQSIG